MNKKKFFVKKIGPVDFTLLISTVILVVTGVVAVFSASYYNSISTTGSPYSILYKQVIFAITGTGIMFVTSKINYRRWKDLSWLILAASLVLLVLVLTPIGHTVNGARRWIVLGPITIMPGEIAKFAMIIYTATFLSNGRDKIKSFKRGILPLALVTAIVFALIMLQPNFSVGATICFIVFGMMIVAGLPTFYVWMLCLVGGTGGMALILMDPDGYRFARLTGFLHPFKHAMGDAFQVVQSLLALGTGGLYGVGIGKSVQKTLYLPEPHNDFILAIIGEETGFLGITFILIAYVVLIWRAILISVRAKDTFAMYLSFGIAIMIGTQVIFNLGVVTSSLPATGISLPFISYGGNALWIFMGCAGILLNISKKRELVPTFKVKEYRLENK